jgi:hypothetical protein
MRILLILLYLISSSCFASEFTCYSGGEIIYHGIVDDIAWNDDSVFIVIDKHTHKESYIWATNCIFKV